MAMSYGPGGYLTQNNRFAQLLNSQPSYNQGTHTGGMADVLRQALIGYSMGTDQRQQREANEAMMRGLQPQQMPEGVQGPPQAGGYQQALQGLQGMEGNEYAGRLAQQLQMLNLSRQAKLADTASERAYQEKQGDVQFGRQKELYGIKREQSLRDIFDKLSLEDSLARSREADKPYLEYGLQPPSRGAAGAPQAPAGAPPGIPAVTPPQMPGQQGAVPQSGPEALAAAKARQAAETTRAQESAKAEVKKESSFRAASNALNDYERKAQTVTSTIDRALQNVSGWSTGYGSYLSALPNTDARALENDLNTIKANVGFDNLQKLRDASPTGGALGQVSERENTLLQAINGALDPMQRAQLVQNLQTIRELYPQVLAEKQAAFRADYRDMVPPEQGASGGAQEYDYIPGRGIVPRGQ